MHFRVKHFLAVALLALALLAGGAGRLQAQQKPVDCNTSSSTACTTSSDAGNGTQGDAPYVAFGKLNANDAQLYGMFGVTGILYGNGAVPNALTAATGAEILAAIFAGSCNAQTGTSYTGVLSDANNCVTMSNAAANTFCVPPNSSVAYPVGTQLTIEELGAGITTVAPAGASGCAGSGVTIDSASYGSSTTQTYAFAGAYDFLQIRETAANVWLVTAVGPGRATINAGTNVTESGTPANLTINSSGGGGSSAWSSLANPTANLVLSMGGFTTTFNQTSAVDWIWANTTAATSGASASSPFFELEGNYWNGSASATDSWTMQDVVASGTNGASTLTFAHTGSTGPASIGVSSGGNIGTLSQQGTNTYVQSPSNGILRLQGGGVEQADFANNGGNKPGVELKYPVALLSGQSISQTTVTGTTAGTAVWSEPFQGGGNGGTVLSVTVVYLSGYENTTGTAQTFALPGSYATVAYVVADGGSCAGVTVSTGSTSTVTLPASMGSAQTGLCEIRGY